MWFSAAPIQIKGVPDPMATAKKRRRSGKEYAVLALCVMVFSAAAVYGFYRTMVRPPQLPENTVIHADVSSGEGTVVAPPIEKPADTQQDEEDAVPVRTRKKDFFTVLVSGIDGQNGGSDTNILLSVDGVNNEINAVSLPRDTLINTDWSVKKLNSAYNVGGVERLRQETSRLLGIPVDYSVTVDLDGFVELVDAIGGIHFDVPIAMDYDDPVQDLHIHFQPGYQYLNGSDALKVVRFRHNNDGTGYGTEDIGRIATQQAFLTTVAKELLASLDASTVQSCASIFLDHVKTDLTLGNLVWIGEKALAGGMENIHFHTLPGDGAGYYQGVSYYILYPDEVLSLVNASFNPYEQALTPEDLDILTG